MTAIRISTLVLNIRPYISVQVLCMWLGCRFCEDFFIIRATGTGYNSYRFYYLPVQP